MKFVTPLRLGRHGKNSDFLNAATIQGNFRDAVVKWQQAATPTKGNYSFIQSVNNWHGPCNRLRNADNFAVLTRADKELAMAHPVFSNSERVAMQRSPPLARPPQSVSSDADWDDVAAPAERSASDPHLNCVWRALCWLLLANVVLFWLVTCVTALG